MQTARPTVIKTGGALLFHLSSRPGEIYAMGRFVHSSASAWVWNAGGFHRLEGRLVAVYY